MFEDQTLVVDHYGNYFYVPNTSLVVDQYGNYYVTVLCDDTQTQQYQNPNVDNYACYTNNDIVSSNDDIPMYGLDSLVEDSVIQEENLGNNSYCEINPALNPNINNMAFTQTAPQQQPVANFNNVPEVNPALNPNLVIPENFQANEIDRMMTPHNKVINNSNATLQEPVLEFGDYASGVPDMSPGSIFDKLMNSDSLENLMARFPYQQLKISDSGKLVPVHPCSYDPVMTNAFHVIYHSRMNKQQQNQVTKMTSEDVIHQIIPESNQKASVFTPQYQRAGFVADKLVDTDDFIKVNNDDSVSINLYNLVNFGDEGKPEELHGYEALEEAFHKEKEIVTYDHGVEYRNYVQTGNEGFSFDYQNLPETIELSTEVPAGYHPNPDYGKQKINPFINNSTQPINPYQQRNQMMYTGTPYQYNPMTYYPQQNYYNTCYGYGGYNNYNQNFNNISGIKVVNREEENGGINQNVNNVVPKSYMGSSRNEPIDPTNPFENCGGPLADQFHDMVDIVRQQVAEIEAMQNKEAEMASQNTKAHFQLPMFNQGYDNMNAEQNNARTIYNQSYANNPSRIEYGHNMVDFSNPESVASSQYMGYNNGLNYNYSVPPVMNPNIQYPYQYGPYQGNWYGNGYNIGGLSMNNITTVIKPTEMDKDNRWVVKGVSITREPITEEETRIEPQEDYFTRVKKAFTARATIVREPLESEVKEENDSLTKNDKSKDMIENTLDKMEQLYDNLDVEDFEVPEEHKLEWDDEKDSKLEKLAEQIAEYDKALANVIWNMPLIDQMTDEMSRFWLEYAQERLEHYQSLEKKYPQIDYRIPYRYRRVPKPTMIYDDGKMTFSPAPFMYPEKKYDEKGNRIYDYDRKRELTRDEWRLFRLKAMFDIKCAGIQKRAQWILQFNIDKIKKLKSKDENGRREYSLLKEYRKKNPKPKEEEETNNSYQYGYGYNNWYGYNDPFQNWVKERQKMIERQRFVYMKAFDHSMTLEEFNQFWDGPQANQTQLLDPIQRREQELLQATRTRISQINQIQQNQIQNQQAQVNAFKAAEYQRLREFDRGCMEEVKTLKDYFDNMGYLVSMCAEDDLKKHQAENVAKLQNQYSYKKSLIRFGNEMNPEYGNNMRPNTVFGKADPAYGFPSNYIDLTKTDRYDAAKNQFMNYCQNTRGTIPLRPIYR